MFLPMTSLVAYGFAVSARYSCLSPHEVFFLLQLNGFMYVVNVNIVSVLGHGVL